MTWVRYNNNNNNNKYAIYQFFINDESKLCKLSTKNSTTHLLLYMVRKAKKDQHNY